MTDRVDTLFKIRQNDLQLPMEPSAEPPAPALKPQQQPGQQSQPAEAVGAAAEAKQAPAELEAQQVAEEAVAVAQLQEADAEAELQEAEAEAEPLPLLVPPHAPQVAQAPPVHAQLANNVPPQVAQVPPVLMANAVLLAPPAQAQGLAHPGAAMIFPLPPLPLGYFRAWRKRSRPRIAKSLEIVSSVVRLVKARKIPGFVLACTWSDRATLSNITLGE
jgi:hypothetical protein